MGKLKLFLVLTMAYIIVLGCSSSGGGSSDPPPTNLSGYWSGTFTSNVCSGGTWSLNLNDNNGVLTGSGSIHGCGLNTSGTLSGSYDNTSGAFISGLGIGGGGTIRFNGTVAGNVMSGKWVDNYGEYGDYEGRR